MAPSSSSSSSSWQRQRGEPPRAHALFSSYLALGPGRSLPDLSRSGVASLSHLKKLSARWGWRERAASWQAQLAGAGERTDPEQATAVRERQLKDALAMQQLAKAQIGRWLGRDRGGTLKLIGRFTPHQTMRLWQVGVLVEDGLVPRPEAAPPPEIRQALRKHQRSDEASAANPPVLSLPEAFAAFDTAMRKAGIRAPQRRRLLSLVRRWLWLQEETKETPPRLSLPARPKAVGSSGRSARRRTRHGD
jgi:hypothetical protein